MKEFLDLVANWLHSMSQELIGLAQEPRLWAAFLIACCLAYLMFKLHNWLSIRQCSECDIHADPVAVFREHLNRNGRLDAAFRNWQCAEVGFEILNIEVIAEEDYYEQYPSYGSPKEKKNEYDRERDNKYFLEEGGCRVLLTTEPAIEKDREDKGIGYACVMLSFSHRVSPIAFMLDLIDLNEQDDYRVEEFQLSRVKGIYSFTKSMLENMQAMLSREKRSIFVFYSNLKDPRTYGGYRKQDLLHKADLFDKYFFGDEATNRFMIRLHNLLTFRGLQLTATMMSALCDQVLDVCNSLWGYFLSGTFFPVIGILSLLIIFIPLLLHWVLKYSIGLAETRDLPLALTGLEIVVEFSKALLHGRSVPGLFWSAFFEGVLEAPLQGLLTLYNLLIGIMPVSLLSATSFCFSLLMVAKSIHALDNFGLLQMHDSKHQLMNFFQRLIEVISRIISVAVFLAVMRPDIPLQESHFQTLLVFLWWDGLFTAAVVVPATCSQKLQMQIVWVAVSMIVRPPCLVQELLRVRCRLIFMRFLQLLVMAGAGFSRGHRQPPAWAVWCVVVCYLLLLCFSLLEPWPASCCDAQVEYEGISPSQAAVHSDELLSIAMNDLNVILVDLHLSAGADPNRMFDATVKLKRTSFTEKWEGEVARTTLPAIFWAVEIDNAAMIKCLVQHKCDINAVTEFEGFNRFEDFDVRGDYDDYCYIDMVPLAVAVVNRRLKALDILLQLGANPEVRLNFRTEIKGYTTCGSSEGEITLISLAQGAEDVRTKLQQHMDSGSHVL